jgi:hypothetical protein
MFRTAGRCIPLSITRLVASVQTFAENLRRLSVHGIESARSWVVKTQTGPRLNWGQFNEENNRVSTDQLNVWLQ